MALFDRLASLGDGIATRKRRWIGLLQSSASPLADGTHAEEGEGQTLPEGNGAGEGERQGSGPIASGESTKDVFLGMTVDLGRPSERQRLDKIRWLIASESQVLPHGDGRMVMGIVRMNVDGCSDKAFAISHHIQQSTSGGDEEDVALGPAPPMLTGRPLALLLGANAYGNPSQDPGIVAIR